MKLKWLTFSISGLILIGLGLSLLGEAIILKYEEEPFFSRDVIEVSNFQLQCTISANFGKMQGIRELFTK